MFIVHGNTSVRTPAGVLGDFCPICRTLRLFDVTDVRRHRHLYLISYGAGEPLAREARCQICRCFFEHPPDAGSPEPTVSGSLQEFSLQTSFLGPEQLIQRVELESRATRGACTQDERFTLLQEPFYALEYQAQFEMNLGRDESIGAVLVVAAAFSAPIAAIMLYSCFDPVPPSRQFKIWSSVITLIAIVLLIAAIAWAIRAKKRIANSKRLFVPLAKALRPLQPSDVEINQVIKTLREDRAVLGLGIDSATLFHAVRNSG